MFNDWSRPIGSMLHYLDGLSVGILVFVGGSLFNKLFARLRVLPLSEHYSLKWSQIDFERRQCICP